MLRSRDRCCAALAVSLVLFLMQLFVVTPALSQEKPAAQADEFAEQSISVAGLATTVATANELAELCTAMVEPSSWEQAGEKGKLKPGRKAITVTNTAAVRGSVRALVVALDKLPVLDEKVAAEVPKSTRVDIKAATAIKVDEPVRESAGNTLELALYSVGDLVWTGEKTPPDFESLVLLLETCVAPQSWATNSGDGDMKPFASRGALVVRNSPEALAAIENLLTLIRKLPKLATARASDEAMATTILGKQLGADGKAEARLYHVADLALADGGSANFNPIMQRLMDNAAPDTWQRNGGDGSLRKLLARGGLVVVNTTAAHQAIEAELATMRAEKAAEKREKERAEKPKARGRARGGASEN